MLAFSFKFILVGFLMSSLLNSTLSQRNKKTNGVSGRRSSTNGRLTQANGLDRPRRKKQLARTKSARMVKERRKQRQQEDKTTVVSCRVFQRGTCSMAKSNIILMDKNIQGHGKCQRLCYAKDGCSSFTYYRGSEAEPRKCVLFKDCNGKLGKCNDCVSGPIMPRIGECLSERQVEEPKKPCTKGCAGICVGPRCAEILRGQRLEDDSGLNSVDVEDTPSVTDSNDYVEDYDEYEYPDDSDDDTGGDEYDYEAAETTPDVSVEDVEYPDTVPRVDVQDEYDDYDTEDDYNDDSFGIEDEIDEYDVVEDDEDIQVEIDDGLIKDEGGSVVSFPQPNTTNSASSAFPTFLFYFCAVGGSNHNGAESAVEIVNISPQSNILPALTVAPMPVAMTRGTGEVSAAYTGHSILTCNQGYTVLTPYGFVYNPGTCYDYSLFNSLWAPSGGKLSTFRQGGSIVKLGRFMVAMGGTREKRSLRSVEVFDTKKPKRGWKKAKKLSMPAATSEHCSVVMKGAKGKEIIITGGKGRENRALKLDLKSNRWYSLNRLGAGRSKHACAKITLNGRPGVVISGGKGRGSSNMTSVEFYDTRTGTWFKLPSLRQGRAGHVMTVHNGKLMVAGGETVGRRGRKLYLDDTEMFTGKRWVKTKVKLDKPRSGFSLVKIPKKKMESRGGRRQQGRGGRKSGK